MVARSWRELLGELFLDATQFLRVRFLGGEQSPFGVVERLLKRGARVFFGVQVRLRLFDVAAKLLAGRAFGVERRSRIFLSSR